MKYLHLIIIGVCLFQLTAKNVFAIGDLFESRFRKAYSTNSDGTIPHGPGDTVSGCGMQPPGPFHKNAIPAHTNFSGHSFTENDYITGTYFFYWWDNTSIEVLTQLPDYGHDGTTKQLIDYTFRAETGGMNWMKKDLIEMGRAGINLALPVHWGPSYWHCLMADKLGDTREHNITYQFMADKLNAALDDISEAELPFEKIPRIGMFYDTTTLSYAQSASVYVQQDLTTQEGKDQFYHAIEEFYSRIDPIYWARIDGKAIVWLYVPQFPGKIYPNDPDIESVFEYANDQFSTNFGGTELYFIGHREPTETPDWFKSARNLNNTDIIWDTGSGGMPFKTYFWGSSPFGPSIEYAAGAKEWDIASIGPGFDNQYFTWRRTSGDSRNKGPRQFRSREGGLNYIDQWDTVQASEKRIVVIETWNELFEGSGIAPTRAFPANHAVPDDVVYGQSQPHRFSKFFDEGISQFIWDTWAAQSFLDHSFPTPINTNLFRGPVDFASGINFNPFLDYYEEIDYATNNFSNYLNTYPAGYDSTSYGDFYYDYTKPQAYRHCFPGCFIDKAFLHFAAQKIDHDSSHFKTWTGEIDGNVPTKTPGSQRDSLLNGLAVSRGVYLNYLYAVYFEREILQNEYNFHIDSAQTLSSLRDVLLNTTAVNDAYIIDAVVTLLGYSTNPSQPEIDAIDALGLNRSSIRDRLLNNQHSYGGNDFRFDESTHEPNYAGVLDYRETNHPTYNGTNTVYDDLTYHEFVYQIHQDQFGAGPVLDVYYKYLTKLYLSTVDEDDIEMLAEFEGKSIGMKLRATNGTIQTAVYDEGLNSPNGNTVTRGALEFGSMNESDVQTGDMVLRDSSNNIIALFNIDGGAASKIRVSGSLLPTTTPPSTAAFTLKNSVGEVAMAIEADGDLYLPEAMIVNTNVDGFLKPLVN